MQAQQTVTAYALGPFVVHLRERVLYRMGLPVDIHARLFDILRCLVLHGDRLVTKDALVHEVWDGSPIGDNNIAQHVHMVRQALGDVARPHRYIETVHGRGYRLIIEPRPVGETIPGLRDGLNSSAVVARTLAAELVSNAAFFRKIGTPAALDSAALLCRQALEVEPGCAEAHAAIAAAEILRAASYFARPREAFVLARRHAEQALELDARCGRAHVAMAAVALFDDRSPAQAHHHLDAATATSPQLPEASVMRILVFAAQGRLDDARAAALEATGTYTASGMVATYAAFAAYLSGDFRAAVTALNHLRIFSGGAAFATYLLGLTRLAQADYAAAENLFHQLLAGRIAAVPAYEKFRVRATAALAYIAARNGSLDDARALARDVQRSTPGSPIALVLARAGLGEKRALVTALERARDERDPWFPFLAYDPLFEEFRNDREFQALVCR